MNKGAKITIFVLIIVTAGLSLYDILAVSLWGPNATISSVVTTFSTQYPVIPFAFGCLCGHLFMQWKSNQ